MKRPPSVTRSHAVAGYRRGIALAKLILALATLAIGGPPTHAEALAGSPSGREGTRAVDLQALSMTARQVAASGRAVHEQAANLWRHLVGSGLPDATVRAEAASALKTVAQLSGQLAAPSEVLADAAKSASAGGLAWSAALGQALQSFHLAQGEFDGSAEQLLHHIRIVGGHGAAREPLTEAIPPPRTELPETEPDQAARTGSPAVESETVEQERAELEALIQSARRYEAAEQALTSAIFELVPLLAPPVVRDTPTAGVSLSVYGFFDKPSSVEEGYGLYTYVLLVPGAGANRRNVTFLQALLGSTHRTDSELAALRPQLNIFYIPTQNRIQALVIARSAADAGAALAAPDIYHFEHVEKLLFRLCTEPATSNPELCSSAWRGPYLLTLSEPLTDGGSISPAHLFVDLSDVHEDAFGEFIRAIKQQVMRPDFTDRQKVDALRLRLLDITLKAADWLDPIKEGIAEIVFVGGGTAK